MGRENLVKYIQMKHRLILSFAAVLTLAFGGCSDSSSSEEKPVAPKRSRAIATVSGKKSRMIRPAAAKDKSMSVKENLVRRPKSEIADFTDHDQEVFENVCALQEAEKVADLAAMAESVLKEKNPEIRETYLKALGSFGPEALPELTLYLDDPDENVRVEASSQWMDAMYRIESAGEKAEIVRFALCNLNDGEFLQDIAAQLHEMPKADSLGIVCDVIDAGKPAGVKLAKEFYESLTGKKFTTVEAAEAWFNENKDQ